MADDVDRLKANDTDALHPPQDLTRLPQPGDRTARQIDLLKVTRHDHARAEAEAREKHLHLRTRRILRFVEDDERVL